MEKKKMSKEDQLYEQLRVKMGSNVSGILLPVARNPQLKRVLKFFIPTLEDAEMCNLLEFGMKGLMPGKTVSEIAKECGRNEEMIKERLDQLAVRGTVTRKERPGKPGVEEYNLAHFWEMAETLSIVDEHGPLGIAMGEHVTKYYDAGARQEWARSKYPVWRTLTVDQVIDAESKVLTWEVASGIIKAQDRIALCYCGCRIREKKCNHRLDACLIFGNFADETVQHAKEIPGARPVNYITQDEALKRLEECLKEGLVPNTFNVSDPEQVGFICMCCSCCCHVLGTYHQGNTGWGNPYALAKSNFQPEWDNEKCVLCNKCVDLCEVNALWHHYPHKPDLSDDFIFHEEDRCIGCGVCAFNCPENAITMKKVRELTPESDLLSFVQKVEDEARH